MPVFVIQPQAPAIKIADLTGTKGCAALNVEVLTWDTTNGNNLTFGIGRDAQTLLNGPAQQQTKNSLHAGFYGSGFVLPDQAGEVHRYFPEFADELWVRNFAAASSTILTQVAVDTVNTGG
jgi:hypothetical protein